MPTTIDSGFERSPVRKYVAGTVWLGPLGLGMAWFVAVRHGRRGRARSGVVRYGWVRRGVAGADRLGGARSGWVRIGLVRFGEARSGRLGRAWSGPDRSGVAR